LTKFTKFSISEKRKMALLAAKVFGVCYNKHSISDGEKKAKFKILGKIFLKVCTF